MSVETSSTTNRSVSIALGVGGVLAVIVGVLILVWPGRTAMVVTAVIASYAVITGIVYVVVGALSNQRRGLTRIGHILLGILFIAAGVVAFINLGAATVWLAIMLAIMVGVMWIFEGAVAFTALRRAEAKAATAIFASLSIVAGLLLLFAPYYIFALWWMLGISFIVLGVMQIVRAVRLRNK